MMKKLLRLLRVAPIALVFAGVASAQTTGTIIGVVTDASTGKPVAGAVVIATSPNLQGEQTAVTDGNGNYRLTLLPAGEYKLAVQLEGYKPSDRSDIRLSIDKTLRANLAVVPEAVQIDEQVVKTGTAPVINVGSAESGSVISSEFVASVPVGRTFDQIARVAPTASADAYGTGFAGAQSPENSYILDGLSVGNPVNGTNNTNILSNFVQEIDVKTGNFSAEYGRATGGVMNVVTKSGSNEFHGSVFGNFTPSFLIQPDGKVAGRDGEAVASQSKPSKGNYDLDLGFEVGGPIMKDRLWFFAGFAPVITERYTERFLRRNRQFLSSTINGTVRPGDDPSTPNLTETNAVARDANGAALWDKIDGTDKMYNTGTTSYQAAGKLTFLLDENNQLSASLYATPGSGSGVLRTNGEQAGDGLFNQDFGATNVLGRYAGKFLDKKLIVEATAGYHRSTLDDRPTSFQRNTPAFQWQRQMDLKLFNTANPTDGSVYESLSAEALAACTGSTARQGTTVNSSENENLCRVATYTTGGYGFGNNYTADRVQGKLSASYLLELAGSHNWKAGVDLERNGYEQAKFYSGNAFFRADSNLALGANVYNTRGYGAVINPGGLPDAQGNTVEWIPTETSTSVTNSFAYYLQDSWSIPNSGLTVNAGIRLETQSMEATNKGGIKGLNINNMWSPRVQAVWDFTGTGRSKVGASWGRFYYAVPLDMGDRAFGNEQQAQGAWDCGDGSGAAAALPGSMPRDPAASGNGYCALQQNWWTDVYAGVPNSDGSSATYGNIGGITPVDPKLKGIYVDQFGAQFEYEVLSDLSVGFDYQGRRQGTMIEDMSADDGNSYFITNPGQNKPFEATYYPGFASSFKVTQNSKQVEALDNFTRRHVTVAMPKPVRDYDGYTLKVTKNFSQNWLAQASYTYSSLTGNVAGVFDPVTGQLDPGINAEYDLATLMANKTGRLPGDRPHVFKLLRRVQLQALAEDEFDDVGRLQRPVRYPGGRQRLAPALRQRLRLPRPARWRGPHALHHQPRCRWPLRVHDHAAVRRQGVRRRVQRAQQPGDHRDRQQLHVRRGSADREREVRRRRGGLLEPDRQAAVVLPAARLPEDGGRAPRDRQPELRPRGGGDVVVPGAAVAPHRPRADVLDRARGRSS
ncbi:MAG: carboxypeptidase regulatory-like domain-containing protein [Anaeromyxobacteraceae bacterium]